MITLKIVTIESDVLKVKDAADFKACIADMENKDRIVVVLENHFYYIPHYSIQKFLTQWKSDKIYDLEVPSYMVRNIPFCGKCRGSGKIDWVSRAINREEYNPVNHRAAIKFIPSDKIEIASDWFACQRLPILEEEEKYCDECGATGVAFNDFRTKFKGLLWVRALEQLEYGRPLKERRKAK